MFIGSLLITASHAQNARAREGRVELTQAISNS